MANGDVGTLRVKIQVNDSFSKALRSLTDGIARVETKFNNLASVFEKKTGAITRQVDKINYI